jgi:3-methyladenine DNA glycosylase AlkD
MPEREYQYFACSWLRRHAAACGAGFTDTARTLVTTKPWWDTVDALAAHLVGPLVARHPALAGTMDSWAADEDRWLVRTAILHQLRYRERTDADRLFGYCTAQAGHRDFFVRKAIGWALREYARTDPDRVRRYVSSQAGRLSPLSVREALKNIG